VSLPFEADQTRSASQTRAQAQIALTRAFAAAGIETAPLDARILLCAALAIDHAALIRDPNFLLGAEAAAKLTGFAQRRLAREPVAKILGRRDFFGQSFIVSNVVLDPRPETETLIEAVLEQMHTRKDEPLRILDLGVGSGAILATLLGEFPQATGLGIDRSPEACAIAAANLTQLGLAQRGHVAAGDWFAPLSAEARFDIVVSNPPYIESADIAGLAPEVKDYDPLLALDGGADGLVPYRVIAAGLSAHLAPGGLLAVEFGAGQSPAIDAIFTASGLHVMATWQDLSSHDRVKLATLDASP